MRVEHPWSRHYQEGWGQISGPGRPLFLRLVGLAYYGHRLNGHTPFAPGELREHLLVDVNEVTGEVTMPTSSAVNNAIRTAVRYGFLNEASQTSRQRCLVVPWFVTGGVRGKPDEGCDRHRSTP